MPKSSTHNNIPGMGTMTDTLDFVKNLWGGMTIPGMGIPGMVMPTLSVDEVNKQISDLKAVESWLTLNMNMLRGTIQALEVQSATISALQSMSETLSAAVRPEDAKKPAAEAPAARRQSAYSFSKAAEKPADAPEAAPKPEPESSAQPKMAAKGEPLGSAAPAANPAIWWNMLQDQFKQAVNTAMASEKTEPAPVPAASGKPAAKPAAKKTSAPRRPKASKPAGK